MNKKYISKIMQKTNIKSPSDSVVTHETRILEVPGSNPGADQPDWGFFVIFLNHQGKCWVGFSLPRSIWPLFIKFIYLISLSKFLTSPLIGTFTWPTPPGPYRACRGRELNYGSHTYFFDHTRTWRASPDEWNSYIIKLKSLDLTNETLTTQQ